MPLALALLKSAVMRYFVRHFETMRGILQIVFGLAVTAVFAPQAGAVPITGSIGFNGSANVDTGDANSATKVVSWGTTTVGSGSGAFNSEGGKQAMLTGPLNFYGTSSYPLLQFDGFTFSLWGSEVYAQGNGFVKLFLEGNMLCNGFNSTPYAGWLQITDPSAPGKALTTSLTLSQTIPDGAETVLLLGGALASLAAIQRLRPGRVC